VEPAGVVQRVMQGAQVREVLDLLPSSSGLGPAQMRLLHEHAVRAARILTGVTRTPTELAQHLARDRPLLGVIRRGAHASRGRFRVREIIACEVVVDELDERLTSREGPAPPA